MVAPQVRELMRQGVIHRVRTQAGHDAWLITGYAEIRAALSDDRLSRSHPSPDRAARAGNSALAKLPFSYNNKAADHARFRSLLQPQFSPKRMRAFRPRVEKLADELLDQLAEHGPPADLHQALARPLPVLVICELLGVPYDDRDQFCVWSDDVGDLTDRDRSERSLENLVAYGRELVARKRKEPGDDIISRMCADDRLDDAEIADLSMRLLIAGNETTVVPIGLGALCLLVYPDQRQALIDHPSLVPGAVEEILRAPGQLTSSGGRIRYARTDLEIGGVTVRAGELVLLATRAANHDDRTFDDPDRFDITRTGPAHLTFGFGTHYCIGAPLARIELQAVFSQLPARFPDIRLAVPLMDLRMRTNAVTGGLTALPVEW